MKNKVSLIAVIGLTLVSVVPVSLAQDSDREFYSEVYDRAVGFLNDGKEYEFYRLLGELLNRYPNETSLVRLLKEVKSPFAMARIVADQELSRWLAKPSEVPPLEATFPEAPPEVEAPPVLYKGEFEDNIAFSRRVKRAKEKYEERVNSAYEEYWGAVAAYNEAAELHQKKVEKEKAEREEQSVILRRQLMTEALFKVLGTPVLEDATYHIDDEVFVGYLASSSGNLRRKIEILVPPQEAVEFSQNVQRAQPLLFFSFDNEDSWSLYTMVIKLDEKVYNAAWTQRAKVPHIEYQRAGTYGFFPTERPIALQRRQISTEAQQQDVGN